MFPSSQPPEPSDDKQFSSLEEIKIYAQSLTRAELLEALAHSGKTVDAKKTSTSTLQEIFIDWMSEQFDIPDSAYPVDDYSNQLKLNNQLNNGATNDMSQPQNIPHADSRGSQHSQDTKHRQKRLTPEDVNSDKAYKRLVALFTSLGIESSVEAQDRFIAQTRDWYAKQQEKKKRRKSSRTIIDSFVDYLGQNPDLAETAIRQIADSLRQIPALEKAMLKAGLNVDVILGQTLNSHVQHSEDEEELGKTLDPMDENSD